MRPQSRALPLALILGGTGAALDFAYEAAVRLTDGHSIGNWGVAFACACLFAALGWVELRATDEHKERIKSE